jgi:hypothetical protein
MAAPQPFCLVEELEEDGVAQVPSELNRSAGRRFVHRKLPVDLAETFRDVLQCERFANKRSLRHRRCAPEPAEGDSDCPYSVVVSNISLDSR